MINAVFRIAFFFVDIIYFFIKLCPTRHKVVFLSRQDNRPSVDFLMVEEKLHQMDENIETVMLCKTLDSGIMNKIRYIGHMFVQMYHIATSEVAVLDDYCIVISNLHHKKSLTVIQMWHGLACGKKFGYSVIGKKEGSSAAIAKAMRMHKNYDIVLAGGKATVPHWAEGMNVSEDIIEIAPQPRVDLLRDENYVNEIKERIIKDHPQLAEKTNILYAPTFRKDETELIEKTNELIDAIDYDKFNLMISLHPVSRFTVDDPRVIVDRNYSSFQLAAAADKIITDYSSTVYEVAIMNKDVYYYVFDREQYLVDRGLPMPLEELPGPKCTDAKQLAEELEKPYENRQIVEFVSQFIDPSVKNCTEHICNIIFRNMKK